MKTFILLLALMVAVPSLSFATKINDINISPKNPKVGDTVKISVKTSGDVAKAVIEFSDLNIKKDLTVIGKNTWGISIPLNTTGEKKFKVLLYQKKNDKNAKDTEKDKFVVSAKNDAVKPNPAPAPDKPKPVPIVQAPQSQLGSVSGKVHKNSASGPALSGVSVNCGGKSGTTDGNGNFKIDGITAGNQEVSFSKSGYAGFNNQVTVKAGTNISEGDRWLTETAPSPSAQVPNVTSVKVNPASINAGQSATFTVTTDTPASMAILIFNDPGIEIKMSGSGTTWKSNPQINNAGNRPFTVKAFDKNGKAGSSKSGTILVSKQQDTANGGYGSAEKLGRALFKLPSNATLDNPGLPSLKYLATYDSAIQKSLGLEVHAGMDFRARPAGVHKVYSVISGDVIAIGGNFGEVAIYDSKKDITLIYLHLASISASKGLPIHIGDQIGVAGEKGSAGVPHLHIEIRKGKNLSALGGASCGGKCSKDQESQKTIDPISVL